MTSSRASGFEKDAAVQQAIQRSADEIQQLKSTATSLRDELESLRFEKDAAVQQAIQQLKSTATSLRDELESLRFEKDPTSNPAQPTKSNNSKASASDSKTCVLKKTSSSKARSTGSQEQGNLELLESAQYQLEEEVQKTRLQNQNEIQHLKQTVEKLRDELEAKHAQ